MLLDLKRSTNLGFLFLQDGYIQGTKLCLSWGVTAVIATLRLSLYPRHPLANQAWLTTLGLRCFSSSSIAMSAATHSSPSFCSHWGEVSTQHPSEPTALEIIPCRNQSLLSSQSGLELSCQSALCLFHSSDCETGSVHVGNTLCVGCDFTHNP